MTFKEKLTTFGYFVLINSVFTVFIALRYLKFLPEVPSDKLGLAFLVLSTFSHMVALTTLVSLVLLPFFFLPNRLIRRTIIATLASLILIFLFIDTIVFANYRFHINIAMLDLVLSGQIVSFSIATWLMVIGAVALVFAIEVGVLASLETKKIKLPARTGRVFSVTAVIALLFSHLIHIWAAAHAYQSVTQLKRYLPLFHPTTSNSLMSKYGWIDEEALEKQKLMTMQKQGDFHFPLQPLQTETVENPPNIVFLVIDSWREETFNAENTPNLWNFAQNGTIYQEHLSTGNATRAGVFGFFYGIPSTYWHSAIDNKTSPVFIDRMQELDYQLGIFASARLTSPEFDQTVFLKVPDLRKESTGDTAVARDQNITEEWLDWFEQKDDSKPSFSFLFYDAPHGYAFPEDYDHRYEPMLSEVNYLKLNNNTDPMPLMNRYKTSVHFIDSLAKQVLNALSASGEMENTIVVITGDHGEELNDNKQNYWGHNGNFSNPQVHVPFAIIGKGVPKNTNGWNNRFTSHQDVVPTLMQNYLGVKNPVQDYSMGVNLLGKPIDRDWLLVSSYSKYAVVTHKDIMEVGSVGQFSYVDKKYKPLKDQPDYELLQQALEQISRFSK
ncbi:choline-sulfatase [Psychrobacter sp. JCM 18901]|mgnify:CR=1 FL=1|uniref:DUF3413 domain-containing protein n=1 Tax=unclassified Psychrobacter TaxID=196806 RepID=UPI0004343C8E|nr:MULTISPECIES: DUF3413 domain-containing protein [unclassified Psychrobacter]GAF54903.1 choline-sulfatase [Psychrobacter sp. JCM 18901]